MALWPIHNSIVLSPLPLSKHTYHSLQNGLGPAYLQALLRRLEQRLSAAGVTSDGAQSLLRQLSPSAPAGRRLERYPVRVMLCAYMIKEHPEVVFNSVVSCNSMITGAMGGGGGGLGECVGVLRVVCLLGARCMLAFASAGVSGASAYSQGPAAVVVLHWCKLQGRSDLTCHVWLYVLCAG